MTITISTDTLAHINTKGTTIAIARDNGTGHQAGLTNSAQETLRRLGLLKETLGRNAGDFRIILERNEPPEGSYIHEGDDCHNSWHIVGLQVTSAKHVVDSLKVLTGVEPTHTGGKLHYDADQLKTMLDNLALDTRGHQR